MSGIQTNDDLTNYITEDTVLLPDCKDSFTRVTKINKMIMRMTFFVRHSFPKLSVAGECELM